MSTLIDSRVDLATYPCQTTMTVRYGDMDADGLFADVAIARYVEQSRSLLIIEALQKAGIVLNSGDIGMLIASMRIEMVAHRASGHDIVLASGVSGSGRTSVVLRVALFSDGVCLAVADNVMVIISRESGRPMALPEALREQLEQFACRVPVAAAIAEQSDQSDSREN